MRETPAAREPLELTLAEYEAVRANPLRFSIVPGHEIAAVERTVETTERFSVVEKFGSSGKVAELHDPRAG